MDIAIFTAAQRVTCKDIFDFYGKDHQTVKACEELGELVAAAARRALPPDGRDSIADFIEESADVLIMLQQLFPDLSADMLPKKRWDDRWTLVVNDATLMTAVLQQNENADEFILRLFAANAVSSILFAVFSTRRADALFEKIEEKLNRQIERMRAARAAKESAAAPARDVLPDAVDSRASDAAREFVAKCLRKDRSSYSE